MLIRVVEIGFYYINIGEWWVEEGMESWDLYVLKFIVGDVY